MCLFAIAEQEDIVSDGDGPSMITLGQRFFAKFPLMVVYDRAQATGVMSIGKSKDTGGGNEFKV